MYSGCKVAAEGISSAVEPTGTGKGKGTGTGERNKFFQSKESKYEYMSPFSREHSSEWLRPASRLSPTFDPLRSPKPTLTGQFHYAVFRRSVAVTAMRTNGEAQRVLVVETLSRYIACKPSDPENTAHGH